MRNTFRSGGGLVACHSPRATIEDAAIAVIEAKREKYRQRQTLLDKAREMRARDELRASSLEVLRTLLLKFWNAGTGLCCPEIATLQGAMQIPFSQATIFRALNELEELGMLCREPRRFPQDVIERGRRVTKWVQASSLFHFAMDAARTFAISADKTARKAAHRAKKTATLLDSAQKRVSEAAKAIGDLFSDSQPTRPEPAVSVSMWKPPTSALLNSALIRGAASPRTVFREDAERADARIGFSGAARRA